VNAARDDEIAQYISISDTTPRPKVFITIKPWRTAPRVNMIAKISMAVLILKTPDPTAMLVELAMSLAPIDQAIHAESAKPAAIAISVNHTTNPTLTKR